jgi:hypothetical protein
LEGTFSQSLTYRVEEFRNNVGFTYSWPGFQDISIQERTDDSTGSTTKKQGENRKHQPKTLLVAPGDRPDRLLTGDCISRSVVGELNWRKDHTPQEGYRNEGRAEHA